jgi:hypothetical protein
MYPEYWIYNRCQCATPAVPSERLLLLVGHLQKAFSQVDCVGDTLLGLKGRRVRMALMTAIGVTDRKGAGRAAGQEQRLRRSAAVVRV